MVRKNQLNQGKIRNLYFHFALDIIFGVIFHSSRMLALPSSWNSILVSEITAPYFAELSNFIETEYTMGECFPSKSAIFRAFEMVSPEQVKVVMLGQDPYHTPGAAMGLAFSVPSGSKSQPSLRNIFKELASDVGVIRSNTDLSDWASQGVLLLNSVLSVRSGEAASHKSHGWEYFTDAVIRELSRKREGIVFVLWGNYAISKSELIDHSKHLVLTAPHPSPFSAYTGFFGSKPFSRINGYLAEKGQEGISW